MSTDTAVFVCKLILVDGLPLDKIPFVDCPEFDLGGDKPDLTDSDRAVLHPPSDPAGDDDAQDDDAATGKMAQLSVQGVSVAAAGNVRTGAVPTPGPAASAAKPIQHPVHDVRDAAGDEDDDVDVEDHGNDDDDDAGVDIKWDDDDDNGDELGAHEMQEKLELPYRYVKGTDGLPLIPPGLLDILRKQREEFF